jgi:hypothetical protein
MSVANARISTDIWSDDITVTASPAAVSTLPAAHLQNSQPQRKWRSTSTADQTLTMDLGQERQVSMVALYAHNLSGSGTVQLQGATDTGFTAIVFDQTWDALDPIYGWGEFPWGMVGWGGYDDEAGWRYQYTIKWFGRTVARYWRIIISDASNGDGYLQAGRLMLGDHLELETNIDWSPEADWVNPSKIIETRASATRSDNREPYRVMRCSNSYLNKIESGKLLDLKRFRGVTKDVLISLYPDDGSTLERRTTMLGRMIEWEPSRHVQYQLWTTGFTFRESI